MGHHRFPLCVHCALLCCRRKTGKNKNGNISLKLFQLNYTMHSGFPSFSVRVAWTGAENVFICIKYITASMRLLFTLLQRFAVKMAFTLNKMEKWMCHSNLSLRISISDWLLDAGTTASSANCIGFPSLYVLQTATGRWIADRANKRILCSLAFKLRIVKSYGSECARRNAVKWISEWADDKGN